MRKELESRNTISKKWRNLIEQSSVTVEKPKTVNSYTTPQKKCCMSLGNQSIFIVEDGWVSIFKVVCRNPMLLIVSKEDKVVSAKVVGTIEDFFDRHVL